MRSSEYILTHPIKPTEFEHDANGNITSAVIHIENSTILDREILISSHLTTGNRLTFEGDSFFLQLTPDRLNEISGMVIKDKKEEIKRIARESKHIPHLQLTIERTDKSQHPEENIIWKFNKN